MVFSYTSTGATDRSTIIKGDVGFISGTWRGSGSPSGTIVTGGSVVLAHDVTMGSAKAVSGTVNMGTAKYIFSAKNQTGGGDSKNGYVRISGLDPGNEQSGDWWAFVTV